MGKNQAVRFKGFREFKPLQKAEGQAGGEGGPVVTIGNFDGVHRGHQAIIKAAKSMASEIGAPVLVYTFRPHPQVALRPGKQLALLSTYQEKLERIESFGVDGILEEPFSREFSMTTAEQFFLEVIIGKLKATGVVVGYNFNFGKGREGRPEILQSLSENAGIKFQAVSAYKDEKSAGTISSSAIRKSLGAGEVEKANQLLGYSFFYRGIVTKGEQRGRKLGFPTANLKIEEKLVLPYGVYASQSMVSGPGFSKPIVTKSVTNIGLRPTFTDSKTPVVETHLLDFDAELYGTCLEVRFLKKIREEKKFSGADGLVAQIKLDCELARQIS